MLVKILFTTSQIVFVIVKIQIPKRNSKVKIKESIEKGKVTFSFEFSLAHVSVSLIIIKTLIF